MKVSNPGLAQTATVPSTRAEIPSSTASSRSSRSTRPW